MKRGFYETDFRRLTSVLQDIKSRSSEATLDGWGVAIWWGDKVSDTKTDFMGSAYFNGWEAEESVRETVFTAFTLLTKKYGPDL